MSLNTAQKLLSESTPKKSHCAGNNYKKNRPLERHVRIHVLKVPVTKLQVDCCRIAVRVSQHLLQATRVNPTPHAINGKASSDSV